MIGAVLTIISGILLTILGLIFVYKKMNRAQLSMNLVSGKTKEHHQGLSTKLPWSSLQKPEINMTPNVLATSGGFVFMTWEEFIRTEKWKEIEPMTFETSDGLLEGRWAAPISPLKGRLNKFIKQGPFVSAFMTKVRIDGKIAGNLSKKTTHLAIDERDSDTNVVLAQMFGGDAVVVDFEEENGISVSNPYLFDLNLPKSSKEAKERLYASQQFEESLRNIADLIPDPDKRADAVLAATGMAQKTMFKLEGLEMDNLAKAVVEAFTKK